MIIIYNTIGLILAAAAAVLAVLVFAVTGGGRFGLLVIMFGVFAAAFDLWYRGKRDRRWFAPTGGGSFFFLPLWGFAVAVSLLGVLMLVVPPRDRNGNRAPIAGQATPRNGVAPQPESPASAPGMGAPGQQPAETVGREAVSPSTPVAKDAPLTEVEKKLVQARQPEPEHRALESPVPKILSEEFGNIDAATELKEGQKIEAYSGGRWWPAEVVSVHDDGSVRVHYIDFTSSADETFKRGRLRHPELAPEERGVQVPPTVGELAEGRGEIDASTPLTAGQKIEAYWGGKWWPAEIVSLDEDERVRIHYTGFSAASDETLERIRLRPLKVAQNEREIPKPQTIDKSPEVVGDIDASTRLKVGQKVETRWGGAWYASKVVSVLDDGTVKVNYTGWSKQSDEVVERKRLRKPRGIVGPGGRPD